MHTHGYLPYDSAHSDHTKNNIRYNPAKRIIVFASNTEKVIIRFDELRVFEHVLSKSIFSAKLQGPVLNSRRNKNAIPFVTTYYPHINDKSLMQKMKKKFKNINNEHLQSLHKDKNFILSLKQPNNLYKELASSRFVSNLKNISKPGTYECSDKRCKVCT